MTLLSRAILSFAKTPIFGWSGSGWDQLDQKADLITYTRPLSTSDTGEKLRNMLTDPANPIDPAYTILCFGEEGEMPYLRGRTVRNVKVSAYLDATILMAAELSANLMEFTDNLSASGVILSVNRHSRSLPFCAREATGASNDNDDPTIRYADTNIYLPSDITLNTDMELQIGLDYYDIESVFNPHGMVACRCVTKRAATPHG